MPRLKEKLRRIYRGELYAFHRLRRKGFLRDAGWFESFRAKSSVDREGNPIPWITYPALAFLEPRIRADMIVFEYGAGNSTLWWGRRVKRIVACEHDAAWVDKIKPELPATVELRCVPLEENAYALEITNVGEKFDIVSIDGRDRVNCLKNSLVALKSDGVILLDNSDRERYAEGIAVVLDRGFRRLDFEGLSPISRMRSRTTFFYRRENCLGI